MYNGRKNTPWFTGFTAHPCIEVLETEKIHEDFSSECPATANRAEADAGGFERKPMAYRVHLLQQQINLLNIVIWQKLKQA